MLKPNTASLRSWGVLFYKVVGKSQQQRIELSDRMRKREYWKMGYSGEMSEGSRKRLKKCLDAFCMTRGKRWVISPVSGKKMPFSAAFVTLTLSYNCDISFEKERLPVMLKKFNQWMQRSCGVSEYVWRLERMKNDRVHAHYMIDKPIHYMAVRRVWNKLQYKEGLMGKYLAEHGHIDAPSTDVQGVKNVKSVAGYVRKYMSKESENDLRLFGKVWDCSSRLKKWTYPVVADCWEECEDLMASVGKWRELLFASENCFGIEGFVFSRVASVAKYFRRKLKESCLLSGVVWGGGRGEFSGGAVVV